MLNERLALQNWARNIIGDQSREGSGSGLNLGANEWAALARSSPESARRLAEALGSPVHARQMEAALARIAPPALMPEESAPAGLQPPPPNQGLLDGLNSGPQQNGGFLQALQRLLAGRGQSGGLGSKQGQPSGRWNPPPKQLEDRDLMWGPLEDW